MSPKLKKNLYHELKNSNMDATLVTKSKGSPYSR